MRRLTTYSSACAAVPLFATLSSLAQAATHYVSPEGSGDACTRSDPCGISTGAAVATAGDTVVLMDGTYDEPLNPENSGTADAWITFKADDCALPIIEGPGEDIAQFGDASVPSGVFSNTGSYLRFVGIVSRYWDSGFTNGWTGDGSTSNGHIEYINCIGEGNGRTGLVMYSAPGITVRECISAHNGGSPTDSWSSGIQLYEVQGTPEQNLIERNVSFENTDAQKNNDGSGFIVDEGTQGATFLNNIAFRNGGSCMRLTRSDNTRMLHFSCYHNGMNPNANSPTNPGEFYFTDQQSRDTASLVNSLAAASGSETDPEVFRFPPDSGLSNNLTIDSGSAAFFSDPEANNPDFRPPASSSDQLEDLGTSNGAPNVDIGFDPKCIIQRNPGVPYQQSWWNHAIDYDYIRSIGGVAQCFHPKQRTGGADLGAYELSGAAHSFSEPGSCVASPIADEQPMTGAGGAGSVDNTGSEGGVSAGGSSTTSGDDGAATGGGAPTEATTSSDDNATAGDGNATGGNSDSTDTTTGADTAGTTMGSGSTAADSADATAVTSTTGSDADGSGEMTNSGADASNNNTASPTGDVTTGAGASNGEASAEGGVADSGSGCALGSAGNRSRRRPLKGVGLALLGLSLLRRRRQSLS